MNTDLKSNRLALHDRRPAVAYLGRDFVRNLPIGLRISSAFLALMLVFLLVTVFGWLNLRAVGNAVNEVALTSQRAQAALETKSWLWQVMEAEMTVLLDPDQNPGLEAYRAERGELEAALARWRALESEGPGGKLDEVAEIEERYRVFITSVEQGLQMVESGQRAAAIRNEFETNDPLLEELSDELEAEILSELTEQRQAIAKVASVSQAANRFAVGTALFALITGAVLGFLLTQSITRPVDELISITQSFKQGDLSFNAPVAPDEIGELAHSFNDMAAQLHETLSSLKQRTQHLEIIATLSKNLSAILNLEELLAEMVTQVKKNFDYYHVHIYLLDDQREKLAVVAGTGTAGQEMKAKGHNIPLNVPTSLVARAARTREVVRVDNVREAPDWLPNDLLPDTYSEMAVPITLEGEVVGVLDVQEDKTAGLDDGDESLLRTLANQVAVAIRNARIFEDVQARLAEADAIQQQYVKDSWRNIVTSKQDIGQVKFSLGESTTLSNNAINQARKLASKIKTPTVVNLNDRPDEEPLETSSGTGAGSDSEHALVAPILLRNVAIGNLQFHDIDPTRKWAEGEMALIEAIIDQVAQTAENLRLLNDAQERAGREQLIGQIGDKLRSAPDIESLMEIAVNELSQVLNPARTFVEFAPEVTVDSPNLWPNSEATESTSPNQMAEIETDPVSENGSNQHRGYGDNVNGQT